MGKGGNVGAIVARIGFEDPFLSGYIEGLQGSTISTTVDDINPA